MTQFLLAVITIAIFVLIIRSSLRPSEKQLSARRKFVQRAAELGWREAQPTEKWRVRLQGTTEGIDWTLSANTEAEEISGYEDSEDEIWWSRLGAPNLRLCVTTLCGQRTLEVFQRVVDLGVAIARSYQRATSHPRHGVSAVRHQAPGR